MPEMLFIVAKLTRKAWMELVCKQFFVSERKDKFGSIE